VERRTHVRADALTFREEEKGLKLAMASIRETREKECKARVQKRGTCVTAGKKLVTQPGKNQHVYQGNDEKPATTISIPKIEGKPKRHGASSHRCDRVGPRRDASWEGGGKDKKT